MKVKMKIQSRREFLKAGALGTSILLMGGCLGNVEIRLGT